MHHVGLFVEIVKQLAHKIDAFVYIYKVINFFTFTLLEVHFDTSCFSSFTIAVFRLVKKKLRHVRKIGF